MERSLTIAWIASKTGRYFASVAAMASAFADRQSGSFHQGLNMGERTSLTTVPPRSSAHKT